MKKDEILARMFPPIGDRDHSLLLTITSSDSERHFGENGDVLSVIEKLPGRYSLQRCDLENGRGQIRIVVDQTDDRQTMALMGQLRKRLPDCEFSYVNMNSLL